MMVSADARYPKRVYLRADQEFMDNVERIRGTHELKSSSSAIRYAVDYTARCDMESEAKSRQKKEEQSSQKTDEEQSSQKTDEEFVEEKSSQRGNSRIAEADGMKSVVSGDRYSSKTDHSADAETVRRVSIEIETLAQDGKKNGYLSEEQVKILLAYQREMSRSVRSLAGLDG